MFGSKLAKLTKMMTSPDAPVFESGLTQAVSFVKAGDATGLQAIEQAIIHLSGRSDFKGYQPGPVGRTSSEYSEAEDKLLSLAAKTALLNDPHKTQELISAFQFLHNSEDFSRLVTDVIRVGGESQGCALLLLFNQMWCWVRLSRSGKSGS